MGSFRIKEFYEYQKILIENMEDISDTICTHENLSIKLEDQFMTVLMAEDTRNETLEREIQNIIPDENCKKIVFTNNKKCSTFLIMFF